jgi:thioredoxin-related protein
MNPTHNKQRPIEMEPTRLRGALARTWVFAGCLTLAGGAAAVDPPEVDVYGFDDSVQAESVDYPAWFNEPFLDLPHDLQQAVAAGKQGLMVYFGQKRCAYCHKLMKVNFAMDDIVEYTRKHFDVVPIDIWGVDEVTTLGGSVLTEKEFSYQQRTTFTPTILFYDTEGQEALRLSGYYPPYQFRAALEYVADGHYKREPFHAYLARGDNRMVFDAGDMNEEDFFSPPPLNLDRSRVRSSRPLAVFFEQGDCHACDVLHGQALREPAIYRLFEQFDNVQVSRWADTPVVTPQGKATTARQWGDDLGLFYAPSLVFFDEGGSEVLRVDSVVGFYRLRNVLNYLVTKAYLAEPNFQRWRDAQVF